MLSQPAVSYLEVSGCWGDQTFPSSLLRRKEECHPGPLDYPQLSLTLTLHFLSGELRASWYCLMEALWHLTMRRDQGVQLYDGFRLLVFPSASIHSWVLLWSPWTSACQAPLSMEFCRQGYWSRVPCPPPGDPPNPRIEPICLMSPALSGRFFTSSTTWEALYLSILQTVICIW